MTYVPHRFNFVNFFKKGFNATFMYELLMTDIDQLLERVSSKILKKGDYFSSIFDVSCECIDIKYDSNNSSFKSAENIDSFAGSDGTANNVSGHGLTCLGCALLFESRDAQLLHFKTDLHRVNLKRRLLGREPLSSIEDITDDEVIKIDGVVPVASDDSSSSDDEDEMRTQFDESVRDDVISSGPTQCTWSGYTITKSISKTYGSQFIFQSPNSSWTIMISTCLFSNRQFDASNDLWRQFTQLSCILNHKSYVSVLILRSGRFAGTIFEGRTPVLHKTFRRYTIRAKSGGGQSSHDNKGSKAVSAGAMLRRYGEQALKEDVRDLLRTWQAHLESCSVIIISAPKTMRQVLFEESKDAPLRKEDPRLREVPFMVAKPTFEETKSILDKSVTVIFRLRNKDKDSDKSALEEGVGDGEVVSDVAVEASEPLRSGHIESEPPQALVMVPQPLVSPSSLGLIDACQRGDLSMVRRIIGALRRYRASCQGTEAVLPAPTGVDADGDEDEDEDRNEESERLGDTASMFLDPLIADWDLDFVVNLPDSIEELQTPLHVASARGYAKIVQELLCAGANPTALDVRSRPAAFLAADKDTLDVFRRHRADHEDQWDWEAAGVPPALTKEMEQSQKAKEKEKKKRAKQRKKEQKEREVAAAELARQTAAQREIEEQKLAGNCAQCGIPLVNSKALDVFERRVCSSNCVLQLRRKLSAEAAEKRLCR